MRVFGGEAMQAPDGTESRDPIGSRPWAAVRSELDRLVDEVDEQIDPAIRVIEAVVAGFHGISAETDPEMADLFAVGARERNRILMLEEEIRKLRRAVEELATRIPA